MLGSRVTTAPPALTAATMLDRQLQRLRPLKPWPHPLLDTFNKLGACP
jgi:hypothetical protein